MSTNTPIPDTSVGSPAGEPTGFAAAPAPKRPRALMIVLLSVFGVLALCVGGTVVLGLSGVLNDEPGATAPTTAGGRPAIPQPAVESPQVVYAQPVPKDFVITVKVMSKECFGSAGCIVTFNVAVAYNGRPAEPDSVWDVTYEVKGGDEPLIDTLELTFDDTGIHGTFSYEREQMIQTPKSTAKLTAVATAVAEH